MNCSDVPTANGTDDEEETIGQSPNSSFTSNLKLRNGRPTEFPVPSHDIGVLQNPPVLLADLRPRLFEMSEPIDLKQDEFIRYWPFVDNVWVRQHRAGKDRAGKYSTDYYACRLQRPTYTGKKTEARPEGAPIRKKQTREGGTCQARMKVVFYTSQYQKVTLTRVGEHDHTHDLDHIDKIKRNSVVMDIARAEVMRGFMPASVYAIMHQNPTKLHIIGGKFINRNDVRNASQAWRQQNAQELVAHPGFKYDQGFGIIPDPANVPLTPDTTNLDPNLSTTVSSEPTSPADTLDFASDTADFLTPYLPAREARAPPHFLPHVSLTYATSLDSALALSPAIPTQLSDPATKSMTHYLRSRHDAILIGVGTAMADDPTLNCRLRGAGGYGGLGWDLHPRPVVLDPSARWQLTGESRVLRAVAAGRGKGPWIVVAPGVTIDQTRVDLLKMYGGKYLGLPNLDGRYRLEWRNVFQALAEEGIRSVMVEGGGTVLNELLRPESVGLVSSVVVTVAPTYLGAGSVTVCPGRRINVQGTPVPVVRFEHVKWQPLGEDVVMCGKPKGGAVGANGEADEGAIAQLREAAEDLAT